MDFFNLLTYDYHASTEPNANHHAPLKARNGLSEYDWKGQLNIVRMKIKIVLLRKKKYHFTKGHKNVIKISQISHVMLSFSLQEFTINHYLKEGAEADKLVVGLPTYGRSYTLFNTESHDIDAPSSGPGTKGKFTKEPGYLAYYEVRLPQTISILLLLIK